MVPHLTSDWSPGRFPPLPRAIPPRRRTPAARKKRKNTPASISFPPTAAAPCLGKSAPAARDALMGAPRQSLAPRRPGRPHTPLPNTAPRGHLNHAEAQGDLRRTPPQGGRRCRAHRPPRGGARGLRPRRGAKKAAPPPPGQPQPVARRPRRGAVAGWSAPSPGRRQCAVKRRRATPQKRRASSGAARVGFYHPARRQTPLKGFKMSGGRGGRSRRRHAATWFTPPPSTVEVRR